MTQFKRKSRKERKCKLSQIILLNSCCAIAPSITLAQTVPPLPSTTDPRRIQQELQPLPPPRSEEQQNIPTPEPSAPPTEASEQKFQLNSLQIVGAKVYQTERLQQLYANFLGKFITLSDLYNIANRITQLYRQDGYILSQAIVPEQTISDGIAKIQVIEGFVEQVDFVNAPSPQLNRLRGFGRKIIASNPLNIRDLERYLLLANDLAGIKVSSVLSPGQNFGAAILTVNVGYTPSNEAFVLNNRSSQTIGPGIFQGVLFLNSALGQGERITISGATNPTNTTTLADTSANISIPIGDEGWRFSFNNAYTYVHPGRELRQYDINGSTYTASLGVSYPLIRSRVSNLSLNANFDYNNRHITTLFTGNSETLSEDRLRVLRAGLNFNQSDRQGYTSAGVGISQGIGGLGATTFGTPNQPLSRSQGSADFTKLNLNLSRLQVLPAGMTLELTGTAQLTGTALLVSEQFGLGGEDFGRAFEPSQVLGDSGYGLRASLQRQFAYRSSSLGVIGIEPYVFYDYGQVFRKFYTAAENSQDALSSAGLGVRQTFSNNLLLQAELAFPIRNTNASFERNPRFFFNVRGFF